MPQPGTILDNKYEIETVIGQGGYGCVYRARERLTGETVAIKELVPSFVRDREMVQRFIQEARATLYLSHPHIARTHTIFKDRGTYYLSMEYLSGGSLADKLRGGPLPVDDVVRIGSDLCEALAYAHRRGVIHCDIKPANVLFDQAGDARLADFGIAHVSSKLMTRQFFTASGAAMGTVRYMAPEQLEGVRHDRRVDIYAMGAVLYEMLAGRPYVDFETESTPAAQMRNVQRIQTEPPRPLQSINPRVPQWLADVVGRALRKAPDERFRAAGELRDALQGKPQPRQVSVRTRPPQPASDRERRPATQRRAAKERPWRPLPVGERSGGGLLGGLADWLKHMPGLAWVSVGLALAAVMVLGIGGLILLGGGASESPTAPAATRPPTATVALPSPTHSPVTATIAASAATSTPPSTAEEPAAAPTSTPRVALVAVEPDEGAVVAPDTPMTFRWEAPGMLPDPFMFRVNTDRSGYEVLYAGSQTSCAFALPVGDYQWWVELWSGETMVTTTDWRTLHVRRPATQAPAATSTSIPAPTDTQPPPPTNTQPPPPTSQPPTEEPTTAPTLEPSSTPPPPQRPTPTP